MNKSPEVLTEGTKKQPNGQKKEDSRQKARKAAAASVANVPEPATGVEMARSDTPGPATAAKVGEKTASARQSPVTTTGTSGVAATTPCRTAAKATAPRTAAAPTTARAPATKSWASIAKSATTTAAAANPKAAWTVVTGKKTSVTVTDTDDKILDLKGAKKLPEPRLLRNTINGSGMMHVVAARLSAKGNAVLTCASPASRTYLEATQHVWLPRLKPMGWKSVATKESWVRLVAHGIAVADFSSFPAEFRASNGVETRGVFRWLKKPTGSKQHASVVFSVADQATADKLVSTSVFFSAMGIQVSPYLQF